MSYGRHRKVALILVGMMIGDINTLMVWTSSYGFIMLMIMLLEQKLNCQREEMLKITPTITNGVKYQIVIRVIQSVAFVKVNILD